MAVPEPVGGVPTLLSIEQIARALGLNRAGAVLAIRRLGLKRVDIGSRRVRYRADDLAAALTRGAKK